MLKPSFALSILFLPFGFHSIQAQGQPQRTETSAGTATVSGRVTLKGEPARGITVLLLEQRANANNSPRDKTDENGRFRFTGMAAGRYSISAMAPGYFSPGASAMDRGGQALNVAEGENIDNISLELRGGGVIAGTVTDSRGRPAVEEMVKLSKLSKDGKPQGSQFYTMNFEMYRTDDRGAYRIFGVPEGRYLVSVGLNQMEREIGVTSYRVFYPRAYYPGVDSETEAKVVEVSEGSEATDVDIKLPEPKQTCEISGQVVDADTGQPVAGVEVVIGSLTPDGKPSGSWTGNGTQSGANGEYRLTGSFPGRYALFVRPDASSAPTARGARNEAAADGFISEPVILNVEDDVAGVQIKVRQGASISGVAVIEGTNDPKILSKLSQVNLYTSVMVGNRNSFTMASGGRGRINSDGGFRVRGLQAGKVFFSVSVSPNAHSLVLARIEHNGTTMREGIEIEAGQHLNGVRLVLAYGTLKLRGELKIVGGAAPDGLRFRVSAQRVDQTPQGQNADVDARGQFLFENLLPGEYEVRAFPSSNPTSGRLDPQIFRLILSLKERVVVTGDNTQPVVLVLDLNRKEGNR
jgi:5-hydroxyisourate hydrolase-like protein (transthyretin family)